MPNTIFIWNVPTMRPAIPGAISPIYIGPTTDEEPIATPATKRKRTKEIQSQAKAQPKAEAAKTHGECAAAVAASEAIAREPSDGRACDGSPQRNRYRESEGCWREVKLIGQRRGNSGDHRGVEAEEDRLTMP